MKVLFINIIIICLFIAGCTDKPEIQSETLSENTTIVDVRALHDHEANKHIFELDKTEIESGWTTFRFNNLSDTDHFFLIFKVPDEAIEAAQQAGQPILDHWYQSITIPFQEHFNPYVSGDIDYGTFVDNLVAEIFQTGPWFFEPGAPPMGGVGFTTVNKTASTTVHLEPGEYVVECYVKDENEEFHSYLGMLETFTVTDDRSESAQPEPDYSLTISSENGIQADWQAVAGEQIVEVFFEDQTSYAHLLGHNVQLVKLIDKNNQNLLNNLAAWMDWTQPGSLVYKAPNGAEFIGGTMEMGEDSRAYLHLDLEPGDYAWIAEIPNPADHGMLKTFTVQ